LAAHIKVRLAGDALLDGLLDLNVCSALQLEGAAGGLFYIVRAHGPFDVDGVGPVTLDQVGVVAVDGAQQLAQGALGDRVEPSGRSAGLGDQFQGQGAQVSVAAGEHGLHGRRVAVHAFSADVSAGFRETNRLI
jgi:hypothetical protein